MTPGLHLSSLLASRICHDLISPVGAIGNGLELLAMSGGRAEDELSLIADSARTAQSALRFMRIAFGAGGVDELHALADLGRIARSHLETARLTIAWSEETADIPRRDARLLLLLALAGATALPRGGVMTLDGGPAARSRFTLAGPRVGLNETQAALLDGSAEITAAEPRTVHLALLQIEAATRGRVLKTAFAEDRGVIEIA